MAKQPSEAQQGRWTSETTFRDLKAEIAARNEKAHKEARELRETREREQLGISTRRKLQLDQ